MLNLNRLEAQKISQALRTGVPTRAAVVTLGSGQPKLEGQLSDLLDQTASGSDTTPRGFVFNGGFGQGKSHLLEVFATLASDANFVVSKATVSRNLSLHTPKAILFELTGSARTRSVADTGVIEVISAAVDYGTDLEGLMQWTNNEVKHERLSSLFGGIASALGAVQPGRDDFEVILDYLQGGSPLVSNLRQAITRHAPNWRQFKFPSAAVRVRETTRFLSRLFREIGYDGWLILLDELELIRLQGPVTRGKAYAELAFWMGLDPEWPLDGVVTVGAVTDDFVDSYLIDGHCDLSVIPVRLRSTEANFHKADLAGVGMRFLIEQNVHSAQQLTRRRATEAQASIRQQYALAYACSPSEITVSEAEVRRLPIRTLIRKWITYWDLERTGRRDEVQDFGVAQVVDDSEDEDE